MRNNTCLYTEKKSNTVRHACSMLAALIMAMVMMISMTAAVFADAEGSDNNLHQSQGLEGGAYEVTRLEMKASVGKDHPMMKLKRSLSISRRPFTRSSSPSRADHSG